ncbi:MAG: hypothetical protein RLZZ293_94 [Pseudomonadota bacterium]|jgi:hypothetical protein
MEQSINSAETPIVGLSIRSRKGEIKGRTANQNIYLNGQLYIAKSTDIPLMLDGHVH